MRRIFQSLTSPEHMLKLYCIHAYLWWLPYRWSIAFGILDKIGLAWLVWLPRLALLLLTWDMWFRLYHIFQIFSSRISNLSHNFWQKYCEKYWDLRAAKFTRFAPFGELYTICVVRSPLASPWGRFGPLPLSWWDSSITSTNSIEQKKQEQFGDELETRQKRNLVSYSYSTLILVVVYMVLKCNPEKTESNGHRSWISNQKRGD